MGDPQPNSGVRSIDASRGLVRCQIDAILRLQASVWDDKARVGYIRPIRLDLALAIRAIFSGGGRDNFLPKRSEQKREHQPGPNGIHAGSLRHLIACRTGRLVGTRTDKIASVGRALALGDDRFASVAVQTAGGHAGRRPEFALRGGDRDWVAAAAGQHAGLY